jgi:hypothetical protein
VKPSRITYLLIAIAVSSIFLPQNGESAGGTNPNSLIRGSYASVFSGWVVTNTFPQPFAGTGLFVSDGTGHISGHESVNFNGKACDYTIKGTYTVSADGTGTDAIKYFNGGPTCTNGSYTQTLSVVAGGDSVVLSNSDFPDVATEHWYRVRKPLSANGSKGACYFSNGRCFQTTANNCFSLSGLYAGDGTMCH